MLDAISTFGMETWTVAELAEELGEPERRVRAAVGWLGAARVIEAAGTETRTCAGGKRYRVATYRWTGKRDAPALVRTPGEPLRPRHVPTSNLAMEWLSRPWA